MNNSSTKSNTLSVFQQALRWAQVIRLIDALFVIIFGGLAWIALMVFDNWFFAAVFAGLTILFLYFLVSVWERVSVLNQWIDSDDLIYDIDHTKTTFVDEMWNKTRKGRALLRHMIAIHAPQKDVDDLKASRDDLYRNYRDIIAKTQRTTTSGGWALFRSLALYQRISKLESDWDEWYNEESGPWETVVEIIDFYWEVYYDVKFRSQISARLIAFKQARFAHQVNVPSHYFPTKDHDEIECIKNTVPKSAFEVQTQLNQIAGFKSKAKEEIESSKFWVVVTTIGITAGFILWFVWLFSL